ncbi:hypothetical protein OC842_003773 [Tilletia horrida]|uniref:Uncharacterized protein n=1 Tax=Tilletia horrida TaxID=155126 RepID=A0AAN6GAL2_9BASI|nr:hypothetical protein OC842_003773 [Tilletia horrida]
MSATTSVDEYYEALRDAVYHRFERAFEQGDINHVRQTIWTLLDQQVTRARDLFARLAVSAASPAAVTGTVTRPTSGRVEGAAGLARDGAPKDAPRPVESGDDPRDRTLAAGPADEDGLRLRLEALCRRQEEGRRQAAQEEELKRLREDKAMLQQQVASLGRERDGVEERMRTEVSALSKERDGVEERRRAEVAALGKERDGVEERHRTVVAALIKERDGVEERRRTEVSALQNAHIIAMDKQAAQYREQNRLLVREAERQRVETEEREKDLKEREQDLASRAKSEVAELKNRIRTLEDHLGDLQDGWEWIADRLGMVNADAHPRDVTKRIDDLRRGWEESAGRLLMLNRRLFGDALEAGPDNQVNNQPDPGTRQQEGQVGSDDQRNIEQDRAARPQEHQEAEERLHALNKRLFTAADQEQHPRESQASSDTQWSATSWYNGRDASLHPRGRTLVASSMAVFPRTRNGPSGDRLRVCAVPRTQPRSSTAPPVLLIAYCNTNDDAAPADVSVIGHPRASSPVLSGYTSETMTDHDLYGPWTTADLQAHTSRPLVRSAEDDTTHRALRRRRTGDWIDSCNPPAQALSRNALSDD